MQFMYVRIELYGKIIFYTPAFLLHEGSIGSLHLQQQKNISQFTHQEKHVRVLSSFIERLKCEKHVCIEILRIYLKYLKFRDFHRFIQ